MLGARMIRWKTEAFLKSGLVVDKESLFVLLMNIN